MAGVAGIEPASVVLETIILPLYYTPISTAPISYHISLKVSTKNLPVAIKPTTDTDIRSSVLRESASADDCQNTEPVPEQFDSNDPQSYNASDDLRESIFWLVHDNYNTRQHLLL